MDAVEVVAGAAGVAAASGRRLAPASQRRSLAGRLRRPSGSIVDDGSGVMIGSVRSGGATGRISRTEAARAGSVRICETDRVIARHSG